ncbi:MAG: hypothetical protein LV481_12745 [Methylacidiphilales bacterium]|nr:hypothetical protein [Candidatus Methylacidiphilales bacterium]
MKHNDPHPLAPKFHLGAPSAFREDSLRARSAVKLPQQARSQVKLGNENARATIAGLALAALICAAGALAVATPPTTPTVDTAAVPAGTNGALLANLNAGGHAITNAATVQATNGWFSNVVATNGFTGPMAATNLTGAVTNNVLAASVTSALFTGNASALTNFPSAATMGLGALATSNSITTSNITGLGSGVPGALAAAVSGTGSIVATSNGMLTNPSFSSPAATRTALNLAPTFNVSDYGAKGDGKVIYDGLFYSGSNILTSTSTAFTTNDIGKYVALQVTPTQRQLVTISAYTSSSNVTLSTNALASSTNSVSVANVTDTNPLVLVLSSATGAIVGSTVTVTNVGGNTNANGTFTVASVPTTTSMTLYAQNTTTAINGNGTYTSGGTLTISPGPLVYGHDDTAAIQSAITAAYNANGGVVQFNNAIYFCASSPSGGSFGNSCNSVLEVPAAFQPIANLTVTLKGVAPARFVQWGLNEQFNVPYGQLLGTGGTVLYFPTSATGGSSGNYPAAIAETAWNTAQGALANFTVTQLDVENLQVLMAQNSGLSGFQLADVGGVKFSNVAVTTDVYPATMPNPSANPSWGILGQFVNNDNLSDYQDLYISGFNEALCVCEHTDIINYHAYYDVKGLTFTTGSNHANFLNNYNPEEVAYPIYAVSSLGNTGSTFLIGSMDDEMISSGSTASVSVSWCYAGNDIYDNGSQLHGALTYFHTGLGTSPPSYSTNGASFLTQISGLTGVAALASNATDSTVFSSFIPNLTAGEYGIWEFGKNSSSSNNGYFAYTQGSSASADIVNFGVSGGEDPIFFFGSGDVELGGNPSATDPGIPVYCNGNTKVAGTLTMTGAINSNAIQATTNGSSAGTMTSSEPFQGASYKKVIIFANGLNTTSTVYPFPTAFTSTNTLVVGGTISTDATVTATSCTINTSTNTTGSVTIEGY